VSGQIYALYPLDRKLVGSGGKTMYIFRATTEVQKGRDPSGPRGSWAG